MNPGSVAKSTRAGLPRLRQADLECRLPEYLRPPLKPSECALARVEGWILGVL
ncbi:MAG: hypothetical protein ACOC23_09160 [Thermodesulfobacteriota bacterium]